MMASRRQFVTAVSGGLAGLAGCASTTREPPDTPSQRRSEGSRNSVHDPAALTVRNPEGRQVLGEEDQVYQPARVLVDDELPEEWRFAPRLPDEQIEAVESFLAETEFDGESVFVSPMSVESCDRLHVRSVTWTRSDIEVGTCRAHRPPDERCEADTRVPVLTLVRIPATLDPEQVTSFGSSMGPCHDRNPEYETIDPDESERAE